MCYIVEILFEFVLYYPLSDALQIKLNVETFPVQDFELVRGQFCLQIYIPVVKSCENLFVKAQNDFYYIYIFFNNVFVASRLLPLRHFIVL